MPAGSMIDAVSRRVHEDIKERDAPLVASRNPGSGRCSRGRRASRKGRDRTVSAIKNQKDLGAGLLYLVFGAVGFFIALDYGFGQASRMGPGYFPSVLSGLLMLFGAAAIVRSFVSKHPEQVGAFAWKPLFFVCGSTVLFGLLLNGAGLIVALVALSVMSAA